jgi:hypothetical protein
MRRTLIATTVLAAVGLLAVGPWAAGAQALQSPSGSIQAGTCALTSYTLSGTFTRLGGGTTFTVGFSGGCVGTSPSIAGNVTFTSVGPWSCVAGVALGSGGFQPSNGVPEIVAASLVNVGGEYVIEMHTPALTAAATGNITTLPIPCEEGQVQTTIGGTGTLTYGTTS